MHVPNDALQVERGGYRINLMVAIHTKRIDVGK